MTMLVLDAGLVANAGFAADVGFVADAGFVADIGVPLAAMGDIAQLIFLLIAFVVWVLTEAGRSRREKAERRRQQEAAPAEPQQADRDAWSRTPPTAPNEPAKQPTATDRARVIFEEVLGLPPRTQPEVETEPEPEQRPDPRPAQRRSYAKPAPAPRERARPIPGPVTRAMQPRPITPSPITPSPSASGKAAPAAKAVTAHRPRRNDARRQLGITPGRPVRLAAQQALLWYEILGPPRALRGPHRPPPHANS